MHRLSLVLVLVGCGGGGGGGGDGSLIFDVPTRIGVGLTVIVEGRTGSFASSDPETLFVSGDGQPLRLEGRAPGMVALSETGVAEQVPIEIVSVESTTLQIVFSETGPPVEVGGETLPVVVGAATPIDVVYASSGLIVHGGGALEIVAGDALEAVRAQYGDDRLLVEPTAPGTFDGVVRVRGEERTLAIEAVEATTLDFEMEEILGYVYLDAYSLGRAVWLPTSEIRWTLDGEPFDDGILDPADLPGEVCASVLGATYCQEL